MSGLVFKSAVQLNPKSRKIFKELSLDPDYLNYMKATNVFKDFVTMEQRHAAGLRQYFSRLQMQDSFWQGHDVKMKLQLVLLTKWDETRKWKQNPAILNVLTRYESVRNASTC